MVMDPQTYDHVAGNIVIYPRIHYHVVRGTDGLADAQTDGRMVGLAVGRMVELTQPTGFCCS